MEKVWKMGFSEDLVSLKDISRRLEQYRLQAEAEITRLKAENARLRSELDTKKARVPPKLHNDCVHCLYRIQVLQSIKT